MNDDVQNGCFNGDIPKDAGIDIYGNDGKALVEYVTTPKDMCRYCAAKGSTFEWVRSSKTVAYGASFGASSLPAEAEPEFFGLLASVDEVSMREKGAAEYVESRFGRRAVHVADPVFLPDPAEWHIMADVPEERGFVFLYETERCGPLREAAARFAREKGLEVVAVSVGGNGWRNLPFRDAWGAGPAQFLGYVSAAGYVFTNSFHSLES